MPNTHALLIGVADYQHVNPLPQRCARLKCHRSHRANLVAGEGCVPNLGQRSRRVHDSPVTDRRGAKRAPFLGRTPGESVLGWHNSLWYN